MPYGITQCFLPLGSGDFPAFTSAEAGTRFKGKEKERKSIYTAPLYSVYSQSAQTWITQFYLQTTPCLPFLHKRSPDGASTKCGGEHLVAAYYSFIDPERMKG